MGVAILEKKNSKIFTEALFEKPNYVLGIMESILKMLCDLNCIYSIFKEMCLIISIVLTKNS